MNQKLFIHLQDVYKRQAYLTGLSIGVHLLNLLCLPAIVLVYYMSLIHIYTTISIQIIDNSINP